MEKELCGEYHREINDLEPVRCGLCETAFHIGQSCCGLNLRNCKELFSQGKAVFICAMCRNMLNGRSICAYLAEEIQKNVSPTTSGDNINTQIQQLTDIVAGLSKKVDIIASASTVKPPVPRDAWALRLYLRLSFGCTYRASSR